jgi:type I restriction enzyme S subunit
MALKNTLDIDNEDQIILIELLNQYLPNTEVWLYGSRIKSTSRHNSDLDMVVFTDDNQTMAVFDLKEAFDESDLPFRVDLFTWDDLPESFHENIKREHFVLISIP